jgi:HNH endonuclease
MATHHPIVLDVSFEDIVDFPGYCLGDDGSLWSLWKHSGVMGISWRRLKGTIEKDGYLVCLLYRKDGNRRWCRMHRLILETFVGPCPPGLVCCHADGNPANNRLSNLRWDTPAANVADAINQGRHVSLKVRGESAGAHKLTESEVLAIRARHASGSVSFGQIARDYGMSPQSICNIIHRKTWVHI